MNNTAMRPICFFLHHVAISPRLTVSHHQLSSVSHWCRARPSSSSSRNGPRQPTSMSFSLPRVQRSSSPSPDNNNNNDDNPNANNTMTGNSNSNNSNYSPQSDSSAPSSTSPQMSSVYDSMSKATIIGRTGSIAEIKDLPSGIRCATLRLATNHLAGSGSNQRVETQWHTVQIFDTVTGFNIISSIPVGTQIYVEGSLRVSNYEKDGNTKQFINISVNRSMGMFRILKRPYRPNNDNSYAPTENSSPTNKNTRSSGSSNGDDDFPF